MSNHTTEIQNLLQQALVLAWVMDRFQRATATIEIECTDGEKITMQETMHDLLPETLQTSSNSTQMPPHRKPLAASLGDIKTNYWF
ncbi:MAG: Uncharacterized protein AWU57_978 [Marinobacter sp. T13-3]|jgi:hypothetical protein|nr:MAG: Uncharacterized protein AWU57_978 [Marinobacter sp. T13-3]